MKKKILSVWLMALLVLSLLPTVSYADVFTDDLPSVDAESYAIIDGDTNQVLFGNEYDKAKDPGSLVQIMTAVLIIEEGNLSDSVTVPEIPEAANDGNRLYLRKGEKINLSSLLEGIVIYNANDAAIAAADHIAGSQSAFVEEMNTRAKELGMKDTTFTSCYGSDDGQTTTARDMAILAAHASSLPKYVELAIQPTLDWDSEMNQDTVSNVNGMQDVESQAIGIKLNPDDPINLAASVSKSKRTVVGVMLGCENESNAYLQMQDCINMGLENTTVSNLVTKGATVATMNFGDDKSVRVAASKDYAVTTSTDNSSNYSTRVVLNKDLPVNKGDEVGTIRIYNGDEVVDEVPLTAKDSAKEGFNWTILLVILFIIIYVATLFIIYRNVRRLLGAKRHSSHATTSKASTSKRTSTSHAKAPSHSKPAPSKTQPQKKSPAAPSKTSHKRPSSGSSSGRQGLEARLKEKHQGGDKR
ncbi:MAG: hypothetical protein Q4C56_05565 [Peptococcaceae bacterium]|nr:hypothetical protein [Peptococcaceae bacterium]